MTYFIRNVKFMKVMNAINKPLSNLCICYDGHEFLPLNFEGTYCGYTAKECKTKFKNCLYKYTDNYYETQNVITLNNRYQFDHKRKYKNENITDIKSNTRLFVVNNSPPDPFDLMHEKNDNEYTINTEYTNSEKREVFCGLYQFNSETKTYDFVVDSFYDEKTQMYYVLKE